MDVAQLRSRSAVEDQVEPRRSPNVATTASWQFFRMDVQLDLARFVDAVHVAERRREQERGPGTTLSRRALRRCPRASCSFARARPHAVLLTADDSTSISRDHVALWHRSSSFTAISRFSLSGSALPSNMWPLKRFGWPAARRRSVSSRAASRTCQPCPRGNGPCGAPRKSDIALRRGAHVRQSKWRQRHVLHSGARRERAAPGRYLDDPVALAVGQSFHTASAVVSDVTLMAG